MYRLHADSHYEIEIKKSRFICYLHKCDTEADAKAFIQQIRRQHPDARHHCYAFIIGEHHELMRSSDDGEPHGTAGVPMLECLKKHEVEQIVAVTVRYFGGVLLGAGGLVRALIVSVSQALSHATLTTPTLMKRYRLTFSYALIGKIDHLLKGQADIIDKQYDEKVTYLYRTDNPHLSEQIAELSAGKELPHYLEDEIVEKAI